MAGKIMKGSICIGITIILLIGCSSRVMKPAVDVSPETLWQAVRDCDASTTEYLLKSGVNPDVREKGEQSSNTPLIVAARQGCLEIVSLLLSSKADVNANGALGTSALIEALRNGHDEVATLLIEHNADVGVVDRLGSSPLYYALQQSNNQLVDMLLHEGADAATIDGETLIKALRQGEFQIVQSLIDAGATIEASSDFCRMAFLQACQDDDLQTVKLLIDQGIRPVEVDASSLMSEAFRHSADLAELLNQQGVDTNTLDDFTQSALAKAQEISDFYVMNALIEAGLPKYSLGAEALMLAAKGGHYRTAQYLLEQGVDADGKHLAGVTPLMWAVYEGHVDVVELLLRNGADANAFIDHKWWHEYSFPPLDDSVDTISWLQQNKLLNGSTPLLIAVDRGNKEIVKVLLDNGASTEDSNYSGDNALMLAKRNRHDVIVSLLLNDESQKYQKKLHEQGIIFTKESLFYAIESKNIENVELLLHAGISPDAMEHNGHPIEGESALCKAAEAGHMEIVKLLLDAGARPLGALTSAARGGNRDIVLLFLNKGTDIEERAGWGFETPLMAACEAGCSEVAELLIDRGADINATNGINEDESSSVLELAIRGGSLDIVRRLLDNGAEWKNSGIAAIFSYRTEMLAYLLDRGLAVNSKGKFYTDGYTEGTLLMASAVAGNVDATRLLLNRGAEIDLQLREGNTALHWAVIYDSIDIVALLLSKGADVNCRNSHKRTPLISAAFIGNKEIIEQLLENGATVNAFDRSGYTALQITEAKEYTEIFELLKQYGATK